MADLTCDEVLTADPESSEHFQAGSNLGKLMKKVLVLVSMQQRRLSQVLPTQSRVKFKV